MSTPGRWLNRNVLAIGFAARREELREAVLRKIVNRS